MKESFEAVTKITPTVSESGLTKWKEQDQLHKRAFEAYLQKLKENQWQQISTSEFLTPPTELPIHYGQSEIVLQGHLHDSASYLRFQEEIRDHISHSNIVISEVHPLSRVIQKSEKISLDNRFFHMSLADCWELGKPVVSLDHHLHPDVDKEKLENRFNDITEAQEAAFFTSLVSTGVLLGLGTAQILRGTMNRRSFLKGTLAITGSAFFGVTSLQSLDNGLGRQGASRTDDQALYGKAWTTLSKRDMRDVLSAYAGAILINKLPQGSRVGYIHGSDHTRDVSHYLTNPKELAIKYALYKTLYGDILPSVKIYIPLKTNENGISPKMSWEEMSFEDFISLSLSSETE